MTDTAAATTPFAAALAGDIESFLALGGMRAVEREAVQAARAQWLPLLVAWHAAYAGDDYYYERAILATEIQTLRKQLGLRQSLEERRAKTAERVRRHRARQAASVPGATSRL